MRGIICGSAFIWAASMLFAATKSANSDRYLDYKEEDNSFAVVYIDYKSKLSEKEAREKALTRAAEITVENGYRYFKVDSEKSVYVQKSLNNGPNMPSNLYQDLIIEREFGGTSLDKRANANAPVGMYPGYKIVFQVSKAKFASDSVDACRLTKCSY
jgi:hypothetical protein